MSEAAQLKRFCPVKGIKDFFLKKRKAQSQERDSGAAKAYTCGPCCRSPGSSFRCTVPISQREIVASEAALCFLFLLLRTKCSGWWLWFKDGEPDAIAGAPAQRSDSSRRRWGVMGKLWREPIPMAMGPGWLQILKPFQFDAVFLKLTARGSGEIEKDIELWSSWSIPFLKLFLGFRLY